MSSISYQQSGVDANKADEIIESFSDYLKSRPRDPRVLSGIGPYASCFALKETLHQYQDPLMVSCCDGVGTKAKLALDWGMIERLGEDLVAMNVNDLLCVGATPLVFLDYYACGKLQKNQLLPLLKSIQNACEMAECSLVGGETAEMPGLYLDRDFDLAGFSVGLVERNSVLGEAKVRPGNFLIGIESSGLHSNGYSLVRKIVERAAIDPRSKCSFSTETWAEALLKPTQIYVKALKPHFNKLTGLAHITGGGITGNLPRILPKRSQAKVSVSKIFFSPVFKWVQKQANLSTLEMLETFNCGVGMIAACESTYAEKLIHSMKEHSLKAQIIGQVENSSKTHLNDEPSVLWD